MSADDGKLLDVLIAEVEKRGYYRYEPGNETSNVTWWSCDEWKGWWKPPENAVDQSRSDRYVFLLDLVADIVGNESGWDAIHHQPEENPSRADT